MKEADGEGNKEEANGEKKKKTKEAAPEASFENLPNLSRVVPAQVPYVSFPSSSRYTPVRPLSSSSSTATQQPTKGSASPALILSSIVDSANSGAGGGILVLKDQHPNESVELVEEQATKALQLAATGSDDDGQTMDATNTAGAAGAGAGAASQPVVDNSGPIADMPEPFEYDGFED